MNETFVIKNQAGRKEKSRFAQEVRSFQFYGQAVGTLPS